MSATERIIADARLQLLPSDANRYATIFGVIGLAGLGYTALGFFNEADKADALMSYLVAYFYGVTVLAGCMFFATLQHVVGARWSTTLRRIAENVGAVTPILAVLFLPLLWGMSTLYSWANGQPQPADVMAKSGYLNPQFFIIRAVVYLAVWAAVGTWFHRQSVAQDKSGDPQITKSMRTASTIAVILYGLTISFAGFDWVMSLDPTWASTMFGVYAFAGSMISALCTIGLAAHLLQRAGYLKGVITVENYHDLGKLQFGFIVFWAYIAFSQFMLIWYANLPEDLHRVLAVHADLVRELAGRNGLVPSPLGERLVDAGDRAVHPALRRPLLRHAVPHRQAQRSGHDDGGCADSGHALRRSVLGHHAGPSAQLGSDGA